MKKKYLLTVVGPTGIGKTDLSLRLAEHFKTEILSCDSRQFYREMEIGTAVPTEEELVRVRHHFIQDRSIFDDYSVGSFEKDAIDLLERKFKTFDLFIMVGGSGLYVDAVLNGLDDFPEVDPAIRKNLILELETRGLKPLQERLRKADPLSFERLDIQNRQRVIRALEIFEGTGIPFSDFWKDRKKERSFHSIKIGLRADRELVYERINRRVDLMMELGLLEEARRLYPHKDLNALQTVGYRELFAYFDGILSLEEAIAEIKKNTRRFAKRQGTWFKRDKDIHWFDHKEDFRAIVDFVESQMD